MKMLERKNYVPGREDSCWNIKEAGLQVILLSRIYLLQNSTTPSSPWSKKIAPKITKVNKDKYVEGQ